jgi:hypothetical protein
LRGGVGGRRQWQHKWRHGTTCAGPRQALIVSRSGKHRGSAGERRSRPAAAESARLQLGFRGREQAREASKIKSSRRGLLLTTRRSKALSHQRRRGPGAAREELEQGGAMGVPGGSCLRGNERERRARSGWELTRPGCILAGRPTRFGLVGPIGLSPIN